MRVAILQWLGLVFLNYSHGFFARPRWGFQALLCLWHKYFPTSSYLNSLKSEFMWSPTNRGWNGWTASAISHVWLQYNHITVASLLWFKHPKIPSTMIWFLCTNLSPLRCHQSACLLMLLSTDVAIHSISHLNRSSVCYGCSTKNMNFMCILKSNLWIFFFLVPLFFILPYSPMKPLQFANFRGDLVVFWYGCSRVFPSQERYTPEK